MRLICSILFALTLTASAQIQPRVMSELLMASIPKASGPAAFDPTAISGYPALAWYVADDAYTNGGTKFVLPDRYTNSWHLTNAAASSTWPVKTNAAINGYATITFDGSDDYLMSDIFLNSQPTEVINVFRSTSFSGAFKIFFCGSASGYTRMQMDNSGNNLIWSSGADLGLATTASRFDNTWLVTDLNFNSTQSYGLTNNVISIGPADAGTATIDKLYISQYHSGGPYNAQQTLLEMIWYKTNLTATVRTNVYNYIKTKYGI